MIRHDFSPFHFTPSDDQTGVCIWIKSEFLGYIPRSALIAGLSMCATPETESAEAPAPDPSTGDQPANPVITPEPETPEAPQE